MGMLAIRMLEAIDASEHKLVLVVQDGRRQGRLGPLLKPMIGAILGSRTDPAAFAHRRQIPICWLVAQSEAELPKLRRAKPDLLLVGGFGMILKPPVLEIPRLGCVNGHWSLLPRFRGPHPATAVILADEQKTGLTFHVMTPGIDDGDIIDQTSFDISPHDTAVDLCRRAAFLGGQRVVDVLDQIEKDGLRGRAQIKENGSYQRRLRPDQARLHWLESAAHLDRLVRAAMAPLAWFPFRGERVIVTASDWDGAPISEPPGTVVGLGPLRIATGAGTLTILRAFRHGIVPWAWPRWLDSPRVGDVLETARQQRMEKAAQRKT